MGEDGQKNKAHKSRHASKRARDRKTNGVVGGVKTNEKAAANSRRAALRGGRRDGGGSRLERANGARRLREERRRAVLDERRAEVKGAPKVVAVVPLSAVAAREAASVELRLIATMEGDGGGSVSNGVHDGGGGGGGGGGIIVKDRAPGSMTTVNSMRHKGKLTFLNSTADFVYGGSSVALLRAIAAADVVILLCVAEEGADMIDEKGMETIKLLNAYGCPVAVGCILGLESLPHKFRHPTRQNALTSLQCFFADIKLFPFDTQADAQPLVRHLFECRIGHNRPAWRQRRAQMLVEKWEAIDTQSAEASDVNGSDDRRIAVYGWIRVHPLSVNQLVHVTGVGDFAIDEIVHMRHPDVTKARTQSMECDDGNERTMIRTLTATTDLQDDPIRENDAVVEEDEQTWPTEEELAEADAARARQLRRRRKLPKGMSAYQAAWILDEMLDDDDDEGEDYDDDDHAMDEHGGGDDDDDMEFEANGGSDDGDMAFDEDGGHDIRDGNESMWADDDDDEATEDPAEAKRRLKSERAEANEEDLDFPDEIDTPTDERARDRFGKYRGMKSFRSTAWDPAEGQPFEYNKIFAFENFKATARRSQIASTRGLSSLEFVNATESTAVMPGSYCKIVIKGMSDEAVAMVEKNTQSPLDSGPLSVIGLMMHESKLSVVHFSAARTGLNEEAIKSKDEMLVVAGFRVFKARPIYSTDDIRADKHKLERFFHVGRNVIASMYMPICYGPLPLLMFRESPAEEEAAEEEIGRGGEKEEDMARDDDTPTRTQLELAAVGSFRCVDPGRVILKKIVLSGYVNKVHKNKAVIKYMFHFPEDVLWFRPLELWTKYGRRGRIKEAVGTHGAMKCIFDGVVQHRDTCCVSLYKRAFPKWPEIGAYGFPHT